MSVKDLLDGSEAAPGADRQCGRCRAFFPADPTLYEPGAPAWWLCDGCRDILITPPRFARSNGQTPGRLDAGAAAALTRRAPSTSDLGRAQPASPNAFAGTRGMR